MVRVLTWNVNGLRAALRRCDLSLGAFLSSLNSDIICFQETKLTRSEFLLERDLSLAEGWESFFSCTRGKTGYSGVATFCKAAVSIPSRAEEGLTGLLQPADGKGGGGVVRIGAHQELTDRFEHDALLELDLEGRCVITDHGDFVLFNLYAPALSNAEKMEERFAFKLMLYEVLFMRMDALRSQGRKVVLVGDYNIAPAAIDSCDPGTGAEYTAWLTRRDRALLRSHLKEHGGAYTDVFRKYHPDRKDAYTCWNQASSARVNNYGTRIDLILLADSLSSPADVIPFQQCWVASDIEPERQGSDHAPAWADYQPSQQMQRADPPPALSSRFLFAAGKQQTLASWLSGRVGTTPALPQLASASLPGDCSSPSTSACPSDHSNSAGNVQAVRNNPSLTGPCKQLQQSDISLQNAHTAADVFREIPSQLQAKPRAASAKRSASGLNKGATKRAKPTQSSMRSFFAPCLSVQADKSVSGPSASTPVSAGTALTYSQQSMQPEDESHDEHPCTPHFSGEAELHNATISRQDQQVSLPESISHQPVPASHNSSSSNTRDNAQADDSTIQVPAAVRSSSTLTEVKVNAQVSPASAAAAWRQIHQKMKPPKCPGHKEDCVIREVKKAGPNKGRLFYVCARADGPKPHGRCDHFQWVGDRKIRNSSGSAHAAEKTV